MNKASDLLTADKSGHGPEGISSGHFIGYSMAGLPLFTAGQTPTHGTALLANSEEFGLWYHLRATFHGILTGQASRRIFAFLCLNLVRILLFLYVVQLTTVPNPPFSVCLFSDLIICEL